MDEWTELEEIHARIVHLEGMRRKLYGNRAKQIHELTFKSSTPRFLEGEREFVAGVKSIEQELYDLWAQKRLLLASLDPLSTALRVRRVCRSSAPLSVDLPTPVMMAAD